MDDSRKTLSDTVEQLGTLSHDLSNSLETILQAAYLLQEAKLEGTNKKWVRMIEAAARDAAHTNREIRKILQNRSPVVNPQSPARADAKTDN